jgi:transposase-like protein
MEAMTKHRSHSAGFKRQVVEEFVAGETLHALSKRHDISRQLIRIRVGKLEAGGSPTRNMMRTRMPSRTAEPSWSRTARRCRWTDTDLLLAF